MTLPDDPWQKYRAVTRARVGLARSGDAVGTSDLLDFQWAHARARAALQGAVDFAGLAAALSPDDRILSVHSRAPDRATYIRRPDLGRRLDAAGAARLGAACGAYDLVFVIADGLSSAAIHDHALPTLSACRALLPEWRIAPIVLAEQARVAIADEIGGILGARFSVILIGERPGLTVSNSLGLYLTRMPRPGRNDSDRNCISNIHRDGLSYALAATKLRWLLTEADRLGLSGVALKEDAAPAGAGPMIDQSEP